MAESGTGMRRGFLKTLGLAGGAAAAAGVSQAAADTSPARADSVPPNLVRKEDRQTRIAARYRETDHVKAYYATNRY